MRHLPPAGTVFWGIKEEDLSVGVFGVVGPGSLCRHVCWGRGGGEGKRGLGLVSYGCVERRRRNSRWGSVVGGSYRWFFWCEKKRRENGL